MIGGAQMPPPARPGMHAALDEVLDLNVRDGLVYYRALKSTRGKLDQYAASLNVPAETYARWSRDEQKAFWINAYNVFVLQTVIDHYPIRGTAQEFPPNSIRQIPGAFGKRPHRAAGRTVTLDEIELTILPEFKDPRVYLALGRGAVDSGRLRSEAYAASDLEAELTAVVAEVATRGRYAKVDESANKLFISAIFGWREAEFAAAYGGASSGPFASRGPIERAVLAMITPHLYSSERGFLEKNAFEVSYLPFNWALNDLTGGRPD
jgi:hypothetical protein